VIVRSLGERKKSSTLTIKVKVVESDISKKTSPYNNLVANLGAGNSTERGLKVIHSNEF